MAVLYGKPNPHSLNRNILIVPFIGHGGGAWVKYEGGEPKQAANIDELCDAIKAIFVERKIIGEE